MGKERSYRGSWIVPLKRAMVVSYTLFIVTIALSLTITHIENSKMIKERLY